MHWLARMMGSISDPIRALLSNHPFEMLPIIEAEAYRDPYLRETALDV